jgi:hypothetical protein
MRRVQVITLAFALGCASAPAPDANGFVPLFNGKDLSGWARVNCAPETFRAEDGLIITTGKPHGVLRSQRMYENYIVEFDWMHLVPRGNSGFFIHSGALPSKGVPFTKGHEIQVLDGDSADGTWTGHGDIFSIHGASFEPDRPHPKGWMRCLPSEKRSNPAGQWNHYRLVVNDGTVKLAVNGKEVSGGTKCKPRKGYLCLESEGSECHFRQLRIKELPSTNPGADEVAEADQGYRSLYTGLDLRGWTPAPGDDDHWKAKDWVLDYDGKGMGRITTHDRFANYILFFDWRSSDKDKLAAPTIVVRGDQAFPLKTSDKPREWVRSAVRVEGNRITVFRGPQKEHESASATLPPRGAFSILSGGPLQVANVFIKELD